MDFTDTNFEPLLFISFLKKAINITKGICKTVKNNKNKIKKIERDK